MLTVRIEIDRPTPWDRRASWVCDTWIDTAGLPRAAMDDSPSTTLAYGVPAEETPPGSLVFVPAELDLVSRPECLQLEGQNVPVPATAPLRVDGQVILRYGDRGGALSGQPAVVRDDRGRIVCGADLVASGFFFLSCWEEVSGAPRDPLDRFVARGSLASRWGVLRVPVAEHYALAAARWLGELAANARRPVLRCARWPEHHCGAVFLSHDIDLLKRGTPAVALKDLVRAADPRRPGWTLAAALRGMAEAVGGALGRRHATLNLERIVEMERPHRARSTFYFLPDVPDTALPDRTVVGSYPAGDAAVRRELQVVEAGGKEIGVHGSFETYLDPARILVEKRRLEERAGVKTTANRQHFLRLRIPETLRYLQDCGFSSDASVGYSDEEGYRAGWSLPYHPYDHECESPLDLLELPLSAMEGVFLDRKRLSAIDAWSAILPLLEATHERRGMLSVLWHNTSYLEGYAPGYADLYRRILNWSRAHALWLCAADELEAWWRRRGDLRLVSDGDGEVVVKGCRMEERIWLGLSTMGTPKVRTLAGGRLVDDRPTGSTDRSLELLCSGGPMVLKVG